MIEHCLCFTTVVAVIISVHITGFTHTSSGFNITHQKFGWWTDIDGLMVWWFDGLLRSWNSNEQHPISPKGVNITIRFRARQTKFLPIESHALVLPELLMKDLCRINDYLAAYHPSLYLRCCDHKQFKIFGNFQAEIRMPIYKAN